MCDTFFFSTQQTTSDDPLSSVRAGLRPAATAVTHIPASTCLTLRDSTRQHDPCRIPKTLILQNNSNATFDNNVTILVYCPPPFTPHNKTLVWNTQVLFLTAHLTTQTSLHPRNDPDKIELLEAIPNNTQAPTGMICQRKGILTHAAH